MLPEICPFFKESKEDWESDRVYPCKLLEGKTREIDLKKQFLEGCGSFDRRTSYGLNRVNPIYWFQAGTCPVAGFLVVRKTTEIDLSEFDDLPMRTIVMAREDELMVRNHGTENFQRMDFLAWRQKFNFPVR